MFSPLVVSGDRLPASPAKRWTLAVAGVTTMASVWIAGRLVVRAVRVMLHTTRFVLAVATFRLYRRCPDCRTLIRADARVCRYCGYRRC